MRLRFVIHHVRRAQTPVDSFVTMLGALSSQSTEVFLQRDAAAWRLRARGWVPLLARTKLDAHGELFPVREPDLRDLEEFMWVLDASYQAQRTPQGGVAIAATGRGASAVWEWLTELIEANRGL